MQSGVKRTHRQCNRESVDLEAEARSLVCKARRVVRKMKDQKQTSTRVSGISESRQWLDEEFTDFVLDKPVPAFRLPLVCTQPLTAEYCLYHIGICTKRPILRFLWSCWVIQALLDGVLVRLSAIAFQGLSPYCTILFVRGSPVLRQTMPASTHRHLLQSISTCSWRQEPVPPERPKVILLPFLKTFSRLTPYARMWPTKR